MDSLFSMINGLWTGISTTIIYTDENLEFTLGNLLITMFIITICLEFIRLIIKGKGDKANG